ncbi:MAG: amidohydrolase/deacetylase family metallohydrolase [Methylobacteriaceae bacterium]|nr:amidohydrolase/deacetylase family metallohydrolase [Methylobacteriaceae bacterium]
MQFDLLVKGGEVVDDAAGLSGRSDVAVNRDRIVAVEPDIPAASAYRVIDAGGLHVAPGLIDIHAHVYRGATYWGVDADAVGSRTGVTSWIDAGSPGALSLDGFRNFIIDPAEVRISTFLNISNIGLVGQDFELCNLSYCDVDLFEMVANRNRDILHGVKVRMGVTTVGPNGLEPLRRGRQAAERCGFPMMVHIATAPPSLPDILDLLRPGDIVTHCFTGQTMRILDEKNKPLDIVRRAIDQGIILDIGHGAGSFTFKTAEAALAAGIKPDVISTDIHQLSIEGPMFDMPTCLSKFLCLGYSLGEAVALATSAPARILGLDGRGSLRPGSLADIALLRLLDGDFPLYDIDNQMRTGKKLLVSEQTVVAGRPMARRAAPRRAEWVAAWANAGTITHIIDFQKELFRRGHDPLAMARGCGCRPGGEPQ